MVSTGMPYNYHQSSCSKNTTHYIIYIDSTINVNETLQMNPIMYALASELTNNQKDTKMPVALRKK